MSIMESYEDFIQRHYKSRADNDDDDDNQSSVFFKSSSVIVFHGVCVLPPLLNDQQRDEMRSLRETSMTRSSKSKGEKVTSDVHIISDDVTQHEENITCRPMTSTTHDGQPANQLRAFTGDDSLDQTQITVLFKGTAPEDLEFDTRSEKQKDIMTMSSGYVTNENTDVTCNSNSWMEKSPTLSGFCVAAPVDGSALEEENTVPDSNPTVDASEPSNPDTDEGPYKMSLQNLLKKSQDYRRRQRLLRGQARALERADERALSDKENQDFPPDQIWKTELRNARERRKVKIRDSPELVTESSTETSNETRHGSTPEEHHEISQQLTAKSLYLSKQNPVVTSRSSLAAGKRFASVPAPKFCLSPVRSKKGSGIPVRKAPVKTGSERQDDPGDCRGSINDGGLLVDRSSVQTEQITQLELNLSSLKALISDLESTLTQTDPAVDVDKEKDSPEICQTFTTKQDVHPSQTATIGRSHQTGVLTDSSNQSDKTNKLKLSVGSSICQSYDVDAPSGLWMQSKQFTPEMIAHDGVSRAKRRLLMNEIDVLSPGRETERSNFNTPGGVLQPSAQDQVKILLEDERRQQQDLLQSLAERYQFLRSVSFQRPSTGSRLEDDSTSSAFASPSHRLHASRQSCPSLPSSCRPLLAAAAKGFLTRRLLRTERVSQLIRTIQDTQQFLDQTAVRGEFCSRQDLMLHDRVSLQLRAARYDFHNIIFNIGVSERMKMIRQDRQMNRERRFKQHVNKAKGSLSAATRKALERKRLAVLQKKSSDRTTISPSVRDKWTLVPKICRVSKKSSPR